MLADVGAKKALIQKEEEHWTHRGSFQYYPEFLWQNPEVPNQQHSETQVGNLGHDLHHTFVSGCAIKSMICYAG